MNRLVKIIIVLALISTITMVESGKALEKPGIRELNSDFLELDRNIIDPQNDLIYDSSNVIENSQNYKTEDREVVKAPVLKGGISELRAIVGKSQIIRFDEPVRRISITRPELVDMIFLSPREIIMNGKTGGETTVIVWGEGKDPVFFNLFVENNNLNFIKEVKKVAPNENIEIDFVDTGADSGLKVMLSGKISSSIIRDRIQSIADAYGYGIVDLTETLEPQVMLEVRIVELGKTKGKSRGYNFKQGIFDYIQHTETLSGHDFTTPGGDEPWLVDEAIQNLIDGVEYGKEFANRLAGFNFSGGSLNSWNAFPGSNLAVQLNAAESEGLIKIVSEPRVMVVNGESASFTSGNEVPVPSGVDELGNQQFTYEDVGLSIEITPQILEKSERILLDISAELSEIDNATSTESAFGFLTRQGQTKVEIANNHTTVITGLVRKTQNTTKTKFPYLSNLPVVGSLFDSVTASNDDTELMIFVTASIVKPDLARGQ